MQEAGEATTANIITRRANQHLSPLQDSTGACMYTKPATQRLRETYTAWCGSPLYCCHPPSHLLPFESQIISRSQNTRSTASLTVGQDPCVSLTSLRKVQGFEFQSIPGNQLSSTRKNRANRYICSRAQHVSEGVTQLSVLSCELTFLSQARNRVSQPSAWALVVGSQTETAASEEYRPATYKYTLSQPG